MSMGLVRTPNTKFEILEVSIGEWHQEYFQSWWKIWIIDIFILNSYKTGLAHLIEMSLEQKEIRGETGSDFGSQE